MHPFFGAENNRHFLEIPMLYKELINDEKKNLTWDIICTITYMILQPFTQIVGYQHFIRVLIMCVKLLITAQINKYMTKIILR